MTLTVDNFEDGDTAEWDNDNGSISATTNQSFDGSYSGSVFENSTSTLLTAASRTSSLGQPEQLRYYYRETSTNEAGALGVYTSGTFIVAAGTENPEYAYNDGTGETMLSSQEPDNTYNVWVEVLFDFDWANGTVDISWTPQSGGGAYTESGVSLNTTGDITDIRVGSPTGSTTKDIDDFWIDTIQTERVPTAPSNLLASVSGQDITLDWDASDFQNGTNTHYDVYRSQSSGGPYNQLAQVSSGTTQYTDSGLEDGERYYYVVDATNDIGTSDDSNEAAGTTALPAPSIDDIEDTASDELTVTWTRTDSSPDGDWEIYRSTDGSLGSLIATLSTLSTSSHSDSNLSTDQEYYYTVRRQTDHTNADDQARGGLPALPTSLSATVTNGDQLDISWTDNSAIEDNYYVMLSTDGGATYTQDSGALAADTTTYTTGSKRDGEQYTVAIELDTGLTRRRSSSTDTATTVLPDEDQPTLGNGVEDEVAIDRGSVVSDYGDVRIQIRETGESSWTASAVGFAEQVLDHATTTTTFTGREDGEEYEVRARTETEHVDGAWTTPVSIITKFPGADNLQFSNVGQTSLDLTWDDNADNEDGFDVQRRKQYPDGSFGTFQDVASGLAANTTSYTDTTVQPNRTYEYRVRAFTDDTDALSPTAQVTTSSTSVRQDRVPSKGWYVEIDLN